MATKYFCDGCDRELAINFVHRVSVQIRDGEAATGATGEYEICKSCTDSLIKDANPKNWVRCKPEYQSKIA